VADMRFTSKGKRPEGAVTRCTCKAYTGGHTHARGMKKHSIRDPSATRIPEACPPAPNHVYSKPMCIQALIA
jgi:hypothetical protein